MVIHICSALFSVSSPLAVFPQGGFLFSIMRV